MDNSDRDRTIESLLRRHEANAPPSTDQCVDAELLAGWMEGGLSADARAAVERHAAGCARCQALLASMARSAPDIDVLPWWRSVTAKWLVPVAAIATALVVWISVGREPVPARTQQAPPVEASRTAKPSESPAAAATVPPSGPVPAAPRGASADTPSPTLARTDRESGRRQELDKKIGDRPNERRLASATEPNQTAAPLPVVGGVAGGTVDALRPQGQTLADSSARSAAAAPPPPAPATVAGAQPPVAAPRAAQPANVTSAEAKPAPVGGVQESVSVLPQAPAQQRAAGRAGENFRTTAVEIVSPDPNYRWRILPPSAIQRSTDGGTTWASVDPLRTATPAAGGAATMLTAGSSPSRDVCWIVGRAGLVLLSTNGATWQRRPFPENVDLTGIRASSATNAAVTTADGRQFATSDGGATWLVVK
jgi:putative zinc finger protein